jgi:hypothetical protein
MKNKKQTVKMTESELLEIYLEKIIILRSAYCLGDLSDKSIKKLTVIADIRKEIIAKQLDVELKDFKYQDYFIVDVQNLKIWKKIFKTHGKKTDNN